MTNALSRSIGKLGQQVESFKRGATQVQLATEALQPYARQARTEFDAESLAELTDSIRALGIIQPLLVRPLPGQPDRYEIIAGERRWRAAKLAGLAEVPALVKTVNDEEADQIHIAENVQRENLSTMDLARRVRADLDEAQGSYDAVMAKYAKGKPWVSKLVTIAGGGAAMHQLVDESITADRAVLATVASLERESEARAQSLVRKLREAPTGTNIRKMAETHVKSAKHADQAAKTRSAGAPKAASKRPVAPKEPAWRSVQPQHAAARQVGVELSPHSAFAAEFATLERQHGGATLALDVIHPQSQYVFVRFGSHLAPKAFAADELRLLYCEAGRA